MSGIVGVLNLDGAPADRHLLQCLTKFLTPRGRDAQRVWTDGPVGFGHTLFKTTEESESECQPFTLGDGTWIVADARVDAQSELLEQLRARGQEPASRATDAELILRAYQAWGEDCVEHILGDFAFGIWDSPRQRLFCARDHMGVRPFYYAQIGSFVVFSSAIDCIRECRVVSDRLNDLAIGDFLLFGYNQDLATTVFSDIQRLPPAHCASWSRESLRVRRYWTVPIDEPVFYKRKDDYCARFKELVRRAVGDRLRTRRVGVFMSGGLDSPTLAATAREVLLGRYPSFDLLAMTAIDDFVPDERRYAGLIAKHLEIPIYYHKWDDTPVDPHWERTPFRTAEPCAGGWQVLSNRDYLRKAGSHSRVFFWGEGPDNALLLEWRPYISHLVQRRLYWELAGAFVSTLLSSRRPPFWGRTANKISELWRGTDPLDSFPGWLDRGFEERLQLRARWQELRWPPAASPHPIRPQGYVSLHFPLWQLMFEGEDSGTTGTNFEMCHPYVDLRLLRFLLAVPPLPWCRSKYLLRRAMRGTLPAPVLQRRKRGLPGDQLAKRVARFGLQPFRPVPEVLGYVNPGKIPNIPQGDLWVFGGHLRARSLNHWLQYSKGRLHNTRQEDAPDGFSAEDFAGSKEKTL